MFGFMVSYLVISVYHPVNWYGYFKVIWVVFGKFVSYNGFTELKYKTNAGRVQ